MKSTFLPKRRLARFSRNLVCLGALALGGTSVYAQEEPAAEIIQAPAAAPIAPAELAPPVAAPAPIKMNLEECIAMSMEQQSALTAARASLAASQSNLAGLERLCLARVLSPDLPIRKQQACLGVQIAAAVLTQTEWETRYAVTRNYFSVVYARHQSQVVKSVVDKLDRALKQTEDFLKAGDPNIKVTAIDRDNLFIIRNTYRAKLVEADLGGELALAALREAIGLQSEQPFDISGNRLPSLVTDLDKRALISLALAQRGEIAQVMAIDQVTDLEVAAQNRTRGITGKTFAWGSDLHYRPVPQGVANTEYRPWAIGPEMPPFMAGRKQDRVARASDLKGRADAVVTKTEALITLEVEAAYFKWKQGADRVKELADTLARADAVAKNVENRFFDNAKASGEELIRARTQVNSANANYNEALYMHALGLVALERVTAGGYRLIPGVSTSTKQP